MSWNTVMSISLSHFFLLHVLKEKLAHVSPLSPTHRHIHKPLSTLSGSATHCRSWAGTQWSSLAFLCRRRGWPPRWLCYCHGVPASAGKSPDDTGNLDHRSYCTRTTPLHPNYTHTHWLKDNCLVSFTCASHLHHWKIKSKCPYGQFLSVLLVYLVYIFM